MRRNLDIESYGNITIRCLLQLEIQKLEHVSHKHGNPKMQTFWHNINVPHQIHVSKEKSSYLSISMIYFEKRFHGHKKLCHQNKETLASISENFRKYQEYSDQD